jgi:thiamine-monophosphate kinase
MGEFDVIRRFFARPSSAMAAPGVDLGIGDDCALLAPGVGCQWAVSSDMLVEGRHFLSTVDPRALGHKTLAVNLSDLAACGASPRGFTLALAMPRADETWLAGLSEGLLGLSSRHGCPLVGGDTTAGPLNLCVTVFGEVPVGRALLRSGARAGDDLWVSGTLGGARLALEAFRGTVELSAEAFAACRRSMEWPEPRLALGQALRGLAHAAIDVSDGLLGDLGHVLVASGVGAELWVDAVPVPAAVAARPRDERIDLALAGGDDYELVFTAPPGAREAVLTAAGRVATPVTRIGRVERGSMLRAVDADGRVVPGRFASFDHFAP